MAATKFSRSFAAPFPTASNPRFTMKCTTMKIQYQIPAWEVMIHTMVLILLTNMIKTENLQNIQGALSGLKTFGN